MGLWIEIYFLPVEKIPAAVDVVVNALARHYARKFPALWVESRYGSTPRAVCSLAKRIHKPEPSVFSVVKAQRVHTPDFRKIDSLHLPCKTYAIV